MKEVNEDLTLRNFYLERQVSQLRRLYGEATKQKDPKEQQGLDFLSHYKLIPAKVISNELNKANNLMTID
jgi:rod shape-determining protein MreC